MTQTDEQLMLEFQKGSAKAFEELSHATETRYTGSFAGV
jgi:hypothetical protein